MAYSVIVNPRGMDWPLGFVAVANNGTPQNIMKNVDANNNSSPSAGQGNNGYGSGIPWGPRANQIPEYTVTCRKVTFQGYHPAANNNGMVTNGGNVYILVGANGNGTGNRQDPGAMVYIVPPGGSATIPGPEFEGSVVSPYRYFIDVDVDGEGALVTLLNCAQG